MYSYCRELYKHYNGYQDSQYVNSTVDLFRPSYRVNCWRPSHNADFYGCDYWSPSSLPGGTATTEEGITSPAPELAAKPFEVLEVDYHVKANRLRHHTASYEQKDLIVRRGQEFDMSITLDRPFEKDEDILHLMLSMGDSPRISKGTLHVIKPRDKVDNNTASAMFVDVDKKADGSCVISLKVMLPFDACVSKYTLMVRTKNKEVAADDSPFIKYTHDKLIYVLFNPWCEEDSVYMENEDGRKEYVLDDNTLVYAGYMTYIEDGKKRQKPRPKRWYLAQFDEGVLDCAMYLMDTSSLPWESFNSSRNVARVISRKVNVNSDKNKSAAGLLVGNWSGKYDDATSPTAWKGSGSIIEQYMKEKKPVKYGQCWVFSGVTTTICRALGLPARSVTNYSSAHDTDSSMTIDKHVEASTGKKIPFMDDSIWNFHVWNECWMKRLDLPDGYDGWQVIDSTPQELSSGEMQCGPASVKAIKEGAGGMNFDVGFVFAEVNGEVVKWKVMNDGSRVPYEHDSALVGKFISTKAVGSREREDLTSNYKHPEGSEEEREAVRNATRGGSRGRELVDILDSDTFHDVDIEFDGTSDSKANFTFIFKAKNKSAEGRFVNVQFIMLGQYYTGVSGDEITTKYFALELIAGEEKEHTITVPGRDWLNKVAEDAKMTVSVNTVIFETGQLYSEEKQFDVDKPDVEITLSKPSVAVGEMFEATFSFTNPLDIDITKGYFMIDGAGVPTTRKLPPRGFDPIAPGQTVSETVKLKAHIAGPVREILCSFNSRQLTDLEGEADIEITEE